MTAQEFRDFIDGVRTGELTGEAFDKAFAGFVAAIVAVANKQLPDETAKEE